LIFLEAAVTNYPHNLVGGDAAKSPKMRKLRSPLTNVYEKIQMGYLTRMKSGPIFRSMEESAMWNVDISRIEKWLRKLPDAQKSSVAGEMLLLRQFGSELRLPHSKALGEGLFELRERQFGLRLYYYFDRARKTYIIVCMCGNKTSQKNDITKARKVMP
jgi:putative addiction module killer protein